MNSFPLASRSKYARAARVTSREKSAARSDWPINQSLYLAEQRLLLCERVHQVLCSMNCAHDTRSALKFDRSSLIRAASNHHLTAVAPPPSRDHERKAGKSAPTRVNLDSGKFRGQRKRFGELRLLLAAKSRSDLAANHRSASSALAKLAGSLTRLVNPRRLLAAESNKHDLRSVSCSRRGGGGGCGADASSRITRDRRVQLAPAREREQLSSC